MRQDNLEQHLQGYGDYFRGIARDNPPSFSQSWQLSDWYDGWDAANGGVEVAKKAVAAASEAEKLAAAAQAELAALQAQTE